MINLIKRFFGFANAKDGNEINALKNELSKSRKEVFMLSNIVGNLATKVDKLAIASNQLTVELDKLVKAQLELEFENATLLEGLRSVSSSKNKLVTFPIGKDDDDDLIN